MLTSLAVLAFATVPAHASGIWGGAWQGALAGDAARNIEVNEASARDARDNARNLYQTLQLFDLKSQDTPDKLRQLGLDRGQVNQALKRYEHEKRDEYFGALSQQKETFEALRQKGAVVEQLLMALRQGNPVAIIEAYFFSFLLDSQGLSQEASYFFNKAEFMKSLTRSRHLGEVVRPLQFELPYFYEDIGRPRSALEELQPVPFIDDETMKEEGFLLDNGLDHGGTAFSIGGFGRYDSQVLRLSDHENIPVNVGQAAGVSQLGFGEFEARTSPVRLLQAGANLVTFVSHHVRDDLRLDDAWTIAPSVFLSAWNGANNELRARYDYAYTLKQAQTPHVFSRIQGPQFGWAHAWSRQTQAEVLYSYKTFRYACNLPDNLMQSGPEHSLTAKLAYPGTNNRIQPFVSYRFTHHWPDGSEAQFNGHEVDAGTSYRLAPNLTLNFTTGYGLSLFLNSESHRTDKLRTARLGVGYRPFEQAHLKGLTGLTVLLDAAYLSNDSTATDPFSYNRWYVSLGAVLGEL